MILHFAVVIETKNDALTHDMELGEMAALFVERMERANDDLSWVLSTDVALHPMHANDQSLKEGQ